MFFSSRKKIIDDLQAEIEERGQLVVNLRTELETREKTIVWLCEVLKDISKTDWVANVFDPHRPSRLAEKALKSIGKS